MVRPNLKVVSLAILFSCIVTEVNGEVSASTPQMGWNSWNAFKTNFNQSTIKTTVDLLESTGLRDVGYNYVILDEGWQDLERDSEGRQQPNTTKFPDGIAALAQYVHQSDMKIGIYSDAGIYDCAFYPGSWGYEELDAAIYATWGIDYLKYDNCGGFEANTQSPQVRFSAMRDALKNSGRDIFYSICEWGHQFPWYWADQIGQSYRMSGDITTIFSDTGKDCACKTAYCLNTGYAGCSVLTIIRKMREIAEFQHTGSFADMDMLEIGNANMTLNQERTHMSFWAALKSPLIIGADLSTLSNSSLSVLTNKEIIAISQDPLGKSAVFLPNVSVEKTLQVWAGPLSENRTVLLVLNESNDTMTRNIPLGQITGLRGDLAYSGRDVWSSKNLASIVGNLSLVIDADETKVLILK
ncbi:putative alpha-galactosidase alpha-n-acetylgalactosaminidase [Phaeomoniella chlamydospora]|uniref:Alpha-galactosidase n=1 Tax=Phaeomoniella chlamydospora TaxID=158046 RepID=A0A0G2DTP6_PHACM|nr:putative alpha-galactosidase alpha-n-acetylgalactosaminidase [Phaeomoniella chlamydospora]